MSATPDQTQPSQRLPDDAEAPTGFEATTEITEPLERLEELEALIDRGTELRLAVTGPPGRSDDIPCSVQDEEVAQYMASLMERYGIRREPEHVPVEPTAPGPAAVEDQTNDSSVDRHAETNDASSPSVSQPSQRKRQPARAPELTKDMDSLRALANESARSAVNLHLGSQIVAAAYTKLILAIVAILSSALCAFSSDSVASLFYFAAVGAGLAAIYWVAQYWRLSGELRELISNPCSCVSGGSPSRQSVGGPD